MDEVDFQFEVDGAELSATIMTDGKVWIDGELGSDRSSKSWKRNYQHIGIDVVLNPQGWVIVHLHIVDGYGNIVVDTLATERVFNKFVKVAKDTLFENKVREITIKYLYEHFDAAVAKVESYKAVLSLWGSNGETEKGEKE